MSELKFKARYMSALFAATQLSKSSQVKNHTLWHSLWTNEQSKNVSLSEIEPSILATPLTRRP